MAVDEITITELASAPTYVRRYDDSLATFNNYDSEASTVAGTEKLLMEDTADYMYFGKAAAFRSLGFYYHTAGSYGALTWEYWNGSTWTSFTPINDSTEGFSTHGYVFWAALSGWAATSVNSQSAFWVRVSAASVTTAAKMYSFLRNLTLQHSTRLIPQGPNLNFRDVNGDLHAQDVAYSKPRTLEIQCQAVSLAGRYEDVHLLIYWQENKRDLFIQDRATTATPDMDNDSPYSDYTGRLIAYPGNIMSVAKMDVEQGFTLAFEIDAATAVFSP